MTPRPHAAVVTLTGWPEYDGSVLRIGRYQLQMQGKWTPPPDPQRLTVRAYPRTFPDGKLAQLVTRPYLIRPASEVNGTHFRVTGHLVRVDRREGLLRVDVLPSLSDTHPFSLTLHATRHVLDILEPSVHSVEVSGRLLEIGRGHLLAEQARVVQGLTPERWKHWRPARRSLTQRTEVSP